MLHSTYMDIAIRMSKNSYCERAQVGACVVTKSGAIFAGYNGTLPGFPNVCEDENGNTLSSVVHAEENCLYKLLKEGVSAEGATLYTTLSPCVNCARMIIASGIKDVYYLDKYYNDEGLKLLNLAETVWVEKFNG